MNIRSVIFAAGLVLSSSQAAHAASFVFSDFSSLAGLTTGGVAAAANDGTRDVLRLTATGSTFTYGSAFTDTTLDLSAGFSTSFTFNINAAGGVNGGGDGFVFVLKALPLDPGKTGGNIGYSQVTQSVGIEFDTFNNGAIDAFSDNRIGVNVNGNIYSNVAVDSPFDLKSGSDLTAWIDYDAAAKLLEVRLSDTLVKPVAPALSYGIDIFSYLEGSSAYLGFTSATGGAWANHDIVSWQVTAVPEASTWAMMIAGFGLVGFTARRSRRPAIA